MLFRVPPGVVERGQLETRRAAAVPRKRTPRPRRAPQHAHPVQVAERRSRSTRRWPRPPSASAASLAAAFSVVIEATAAASTDESAAPRLCAVATTPVPSAFVSTSVSPGRAASIVNRRDGAAKPTTAMPYLGSGSSMVCPPTTKRPADASDRGTAAQHVREDGQRQRLARPGGQVQREHGPPPIA